MSAEKLLIVRDLKELLEKLPDDMPLFRIDLYNDECKPVTEANLPAVETVSELEFSHGRFFNIGPRDHFVAHKVLREFRVLDIG